MGKEEILQLAEPCSCEACTVGCRFGAGVLADEDIAPLAAFLGCTEEELKERYLEPVEKFHTTRLRPKLRREKGRPYGQCIFFDEQRGCSVHPAKPLECKVAMGCKPYGEALIQWFTLNHFVNPGDPESVRQWSISLRTHPTIPGGELAELVPDRKRLQRILSYETLH